MAGTITENGFTVTQTATGMDVTPVGGTTISFSIPNIATMNLDVNASAWHGYAVDSVVGSVASMSEALIWGNLLEEPFPTLGLVNPNTPITDGQVSFLPPFGSSIKSYIDVTNNAVINTTVEGEHLFDPGAVVRYLYEKEGKYHIATFGIGTGSWGTFNHAIAAGLWAANVEEIASESWFEAAYPYLTFSNTAYPGVGFDPVHIVVKSSYNVIKSLFNYATHTVCPLQLDLDGDGIETTGVMSLGAVYFDLNRDGFAEATGWVAGGDGLLAIDLNADGKINDAGELFGDQTGAANGFAQLATYDTNADTKITAADTQFNNLHVWIDANGDGVTQTGELKTLAELNITSIDTTYSTVNVNNNGNTIGQQGNFTMNGVVKTVADVYFNTDTMNSVYHGDYTPEPDALFLPTTRGYGTLPNFYVAASQDNVGTGSLLAKLQAFATHDFVNIFDGTNTVMDEVKAIMYRWANVENVAPSSRGEGMDAQHLAFIEKMVAQTYAGYNDSTHYSAGLAIDEAFLTAQNALFARLVAQTEGGMIFTGNVFYNAATDALEGITGLDAAHLASLQMEAAGLANTATKQIFWQNVVRVIEFTIGNAALSPSDHTALDTAITTSDASLSLTGIEALLTPNWYNMTFDGTGGNDTIYGTKGDDVINAGLGDDTITSGAGNDAVTAGLGNDVITGGAGNDTINGGDGNDITTGGTGNDILTDGAGSYGYLTNGGGNDVYVYNRGDGNDIIAEMNGTDTINFGTGITLADLTFTKTGNDMVVGISGTNAGQITVVGQFNLNTGIETLHFSDDTTLDLTTRDWITTGTESGDVLNGIQYNGGANDTINGNGGNDTINAYAGNNIVDGGAGDDVISTGDGSDTIYGGDGNDYITSYYNYNGVASDVVYGGNGNDTIYAGNGNDRLDGGAGNETITDTGGNDVFVFNGGTDIFYDYAGNDTIELAVGWTVNDVTFKHVSGTYTLVLDMGVGNTITLPYQIYTAGYGFETLKFSDNSTLSFSTQSITTTGTAANDTIYGITVGGSLNDIIDGGLGADTMIGGVGNDTYIVDNIGDVATENLNEGTDTVQSSITYTLGTNVENLILTGAAAINATGNGLDNIITGNSAVNTLAGGLGNDGYYATAGDVITEAASAGTDTVYSAGAWTLGANLENLTLTGATAVNGTGNTLDNILVGNGGVNTLTGLAGNDIYYASTGDIIVEAASAGTDLVYSDVTHVLAVNVENLTLIGSTAINGTGNTLANIITGNTANNILDGGTGIDTLIGGLGNDTYVVNVTGDVVTESLNEGIDLVQASATYTLSANVENLTLMGATAINGTGNSLDNIITGNSAINTMTGGLGNDSYYATAGDIITEAASAGTDTVYAAVAWTLGANLENLTLTGSAAVNGTGNTLDNILTGNGGVNTLTGLAGNDIYYASTGDVIVEAASAGTDLVYSDVTRTLATNVENLTLTGSTAINGTGNALANILTGNDGNNVLSGLTGADTLIGGLGNDTYVVDNIGDVVTEGLNAGIDLVQTNVTYTLSANVENITITGTSGTVTGNDLDNIFTGAAGVDNMTGLGGNDTYYATTSDVITEGLNAGTDTVSSAVTWALGANLENLILSGTTNVSGTGNTLDNVITGNSGVNTLTGNDGNDTLYGMGGVDTLNGGNGNDTFIGGLGADSLTGGAGLDSFMFDTAGLGTIDTITDFSTAQGDVLNIHDILVGYNPVSSAIADFLQITDNGANSNVSVDRDGTGATYGWAQIATLSNVIGLTDEALLLANYNIAV